MRKNRVLVTLLALAALGLALLPLANPALAARRRGARFNAQVAGLYTRACTDGFRFTILDLDPPESNPAQVAGSLARVDPFGTDLQTSVTLTRQATPTPVGDNSTDYVFAGDGLLRPLPGQPWQVGDRIVFRGATNSAQHAATVRPCLVGEPEPEIYDYESAVEGGPITVDEQISIGAARVALALVYEPATPAPLRLTLLGPGGLAATLVELAPTGSYTLGSAFTESRVEGGASSVVFDPASSYSFDQADGGQEYSDVAIRPADAEAMRAWFGAPAAGEWRLEARGAGDTIIPNQQLQLRWKLELTAPNRVYLPLVINGPAAADPDPEPAGLTIYANSLASGWASAGWSYGATVNLAATAQSVSAPNAIGVTFTEAFGGLTFRAAAPIAMTGRYSAIRLYVWGAPGGSPLSVYSQAADDGTPSTPYAFTAPGGTWTEVTVPLAELGAPAAIKRFSVQDESGTPGATIYVDDVRLAP
ncbi:MAG TPA: hypothetical protein PKD53_26675 [Chloroflexaceae bacterium]|nr:hypothetical protein [Chloroflexaceae bacterium]